MSFEPTHEFAGIQLRQGSSGDTFNTWYQDSEGNVYRLPNSKVTRILPKPKPGEVWKYIGFGTANIDLELVSRSGEHFIDVDGDLTFVGTNLSYYVKVLNADGTPA